MDKKLKTKWVRALRSGKYKQGRRALCKISGTKRPVKQFCCLGVLCELVEGVRRSDGLSGAGAKLYTYVIPGQEPHQAKSSMNPLPDRVLSRSNQQILARMNDGGNKWNFDAIAGWIEENL
jgi:hypothetical protein